MKYTRFIPHTLVFLVALLLVSAVSFSEGAKTTFAAAYSSVTANTYSAATVELTNGDVSLHTDNGASVEINRCISACSAGSYAECAMDRTVINSTECNGTACAESTCYAVPASANDKYVGPYTAQANGGAGDSSFSHYAIYENIATTLTASPTTINPGDNSTLTWTSTNARTCSIDNGIGVVSISGTSNGGTKAVSPTTTTTYTITCQGGGLGNDAATKTAKVTVNVVPTAKITLSKSSITTGDSINVSWTCTNSTYAKITNNNNPNIGNETSMSGTVSDSPTASGTYTLQCTNQTTGATVYDTANITVNAAAIGGTCSVSPSSANTGDTVTWTANPTGGNGTYTYSWSGTDSLSGSTKSVTKSYSTAGAKSGSVLVTSAGNSKTITCNNSVSINQPLPDLTVDGAVATPASPISIGTTVALSANVTNGGTAAASAFPNAFQIQDSSGASTYVPASNNNMVEGIGVSKPMAGSYTFNSADTYKIRACANTNASGSNSGTNVITESNYGNNCSGTWTTFVVKAPNLTAGAITPTAYVAGQSSTISATITNNGNVSTGGSFSNKFQRATDSSGTGQTNIGTDTIGNLAAGGSNTTSIPYTFDPSDAGTSIYIRACADSNNDIDESDDTSADNCGAWTKVTVLYATCSYSPSSANTGDTVTWTVAPVGGTGYTYSWGGDDGLTGSTKSVSKVYTTAGAKGAHVTVTANGVSIYADCGNIAVGIPPAPDLVSGAVTPTTVVVGTATAFSATITNQGNASTGVAFRNRMQVATDSSGTGATAVGIDDFTTALGASGTRSTTVTYTSTGTDPFWARFCADTLNAVSNESDEGNNCGVWTKITVQAPDLTPDDTTATAAVVGSPVTLSSNVTNAGDAQAVNFANSFQIANPAGYVVSTPNPMSGLAPAATKPFTGSYTFGSTGTYKVRACVNTDTSGANTVVESNYGNDCGAWLTVTVGVAPIADLTATSITADDASINTGDTVNFTGVINNTGTGDATNFPNSLNVVSVGLTAASPASMSLVAATGMANATASYIFNSAGTYQVRFCANTNTSWVNVVTESNYGNNCGNTITVTVSNPPPPPDPTCTLTASPNSASPNQNVTLTWASQNNSAGSCTAVNNAFPTGGALSGTAQVTPDLSGGTAGYGLSCTRTSDGKKANCSTTITNSCGASPVLTIAASKTRVTQGGTTNISWNATGVSASSCTVSGPGINVNSAAASCAIPQGNQTVTVTKQSTYTITCGTATKSIVVNVVPDFQEF